MHSHMGYFTSTTKTHDDGSFGRKRPEDHVALWGARGVVHRLRRFR